MQHNISMLMIGQNKDTNCIENNEHDEELTGANVNASTRSRARENTHTHWDVPSHMQTTKHHTQRNFATYI